MTISRIGSLYYCPFLSPSLIVFLFFVFFFFRKAPEIWHTLTFSSFFLFFIYLKLTVIVSFCRFFFSFVRPFCLLVFSHIFVSPLFVCLFVCFSSKQAIEACDPVCTKPITFSPFLRLPCARCHYSNSPCG